MLLGKEVIRPMKLPLQILTSNLGGDVSKKDQRTILWSRTILTSMFLLLCIAERSD